MSFDPDVRKQQELVEYQKFVEIKNDTNFPPLTVVNQRILDNGTVDSQTTTYPKYAVLTYNVNGAQTNGSPFGDNSSVDAFGRLRVSQPKTLLDSKMFYDKQTQTFDEALSGTATSVFSAYDSCIVMNTFAKNDYVIRQTRQRFDYQPGKSLSYIFTGLFSPETNVIKRVGAFQSLTAQPFDPVDGVWLEVNQEGPILRCEKSQGTTYSMIAPQSAWNIDKMDGSGTSGLTIDFAKAQIFTIDYEWLSLGRVRYGFYLNGKCFYVHQDTHLNALNAPYMSYGNQPVRYEIRQVGDGSGVMKQICCTVISEGGEDEVGTLVSAGLSSVIAVGNTANRYYPRIGARLSPDRPNISAYIKNLLVQNMDASVGMEARIYFNPTLTSPLQWRKLDSQGIEFAFGDGTTYVTGGQQVFVGYVLAGAKGGAESIQLPPSVASLGMSLSGVPDQIIIAGRSLKSGGAGTNDTLGSITALLKG